MFRLDVKFDLKAIEETVRKFWQENKIPEKWRRVTWTKPIFRFLEGPPTANGYPHVGHIRGRTYKDIVLRFWRLRGYEVWAQGGWDEQGLPVELETEKKLGFKTKKDIEGFGLDKFALECNRLVDYYLEWWRKYGTELLALWLDLENAYETRRAYYIEHVWRFIKEMWERGLLFEDYRVLPYCPRCETALSDAEVEQGYEDREDPSIFVKFPAKDEENTYYIIWTTTPWTLIDNEAIAVNPKFRYAKVKVEWKGRVEYWWIAEDLVHILMGKFGIQKYEIVEIKLGEELKGRKYVHIFLDEVAVHREHDDKAHYIVTADFVTLEMGTGLVHIAPAHGPEDFEVAKQHGLPITNLVEANGYFNQMAGKFSGKYWLDVSKQVIEELERRGLLVHKETIIHRYPHCWRCGTPLIYRADRQWFIKVSAFRDKLLEELRKVKIYPEHLRDRFENWIANIRDWTISRSRVWGTPLPVWRCKKDPNKILVIGSLEELKKLAKELPNVSDDLLVHRPWIDQVKICTEDCDEWVREPFVLDVWLDSGVAWIASIDGLRNPDLLEKLYPYDLVTEGIDQTRGWFYSLLATSVLWRGTAPYRSILIQGHVVDKYGQKMSKSKGNVIWAHDLFERWGVDAPRLYIAYKVAPWDTMAFDPDEIKETVRVLSILWNVVKFADTYMTLDRFDPHIHSLEKYLDKLAPEDRWILSRFYTRLSRFLDHMSRYEIHLAAREWISLVVEDLSHRYLRLIRRRVWIEEEAETKYAAYAVLYHVLKGTLIMGSVFAPHVTEYLWQAFVRRLEPGETESVHLTVLPKVETEYIDELTEKVFDMLFDVFSEVANLRSKAGIKLRWPIRKVCVKINDDKLADSLLRIKHLLEYLANCKEAVITTQDFECTPDMLCAETSIGKIGITRELDRSLLLEAFAREIIRRVQFMRSKANLHVEDRIEVYIDTSDKELVESIETHRDYIASETRAVKIAVTSEIPQDCFMMEWDIEDKKVRIGIRKVSG